MRKGRIGDLAAAARGAVARHRVFAAALVAGALLRAGAELGYRWAIWFNDSFDYLAIALRPHPDPMRPPGYPGLLWLLGPAHSFAAVTAVQHVLALSAAVLMYALLYARFGVHRAVAAVAAVPLLFDAFQIQLEQVLLADTLFTFLVVAAAVALCWQRAGGLRAAGIWRAAAAGVLLAMAALTRPVAIALIVIAAGYLAVCRAGWRAVTAACVATCVPLAGYVLWFHAVNGQYALGTTDGVFLWGRTAAFADCRIIKPPPAEAWLCPRLPVRARAASSAQVWQPSSPLHWRHGQEFSAAENAMAFRFGLRAISAQPGSYARTVLASTGRAFTWDRTAYPTGYTASLYTFAGAKTWLPTWAEPGGSSAVAVARSYAGGHAATAVVAPYATLMRWYQRYAYLRGPLFAGILLIPPAAGFAAYAPRLRRRRGAAPGEHPRRGGHAPPGEHPAPPHHEARRATWLCWSWAVALLVVPPLTVDFDYRYVLPAVPFGCLAAALAAQRHAVRVSGIRHGTTPGRGAKSEAASIRTVHELTGSDG